MSKLPPLGSNLPEVLDINARAQDRLTNDRASLSILSRFGDKLKTWFGMEQEFNHQLTAQSDRFNAFIGSSGYDVIGDYTAGPLTLTEYNQLIRYNNELYKLTAATDIPFITAGNTNETWTNADSAHFVSVGDADLRQSLASDEAGLGDGLVTHFPGGAFGSPLSVNSKLKEQVSIFNFESDSENDDSLRFKKAVLEGHKVVHIPQRTVKGALKVGELDITSPLVIQGEGVISIDSTGSTLIKISDAEYGIQYLGDINNRPHGGGLRNIDFRGASSSDTGPLLRVQTWSYFICEMLALQNNADWGVSFQNVAESGVFTFLCRRLGSETSGCIRFEDYIPIETDSGNKNNNTNNFRLMNGTLGLNSGTWIYGTDNSNLDVVFIKNNKIEFDSVPDSVNTTKKSVIYLGQANKVFLENNTFTNFRLANQNYYRACIKIGSNSRVSPMINNNGFDGCDVELINIVGGTVKGRGNYANRAGAIADGSFICTSTLPQDIEPIIFHTNNGAKNKRSNYDAPGFVSAHKMTGLVNNPFVTDANSMTHYLTVMSVPATTEIRRGVISRALISEREFVHITARMKNVSGAASTVILNLDGTDSGGVSVVADEKWHNYTWQIRPDKIRDGIFILTNGASSVLFDGVFIERKDYFNWSFSWVPGTIEPGNKATSPVQSVADTIGFIPTGVEETAIGSLNGAQLQTNVDEAGNVVVTCCNDTSSAITPSFTRMRLRYTSS